MKDKNFLVSASIIFIIFALLQTTKPELYVLKRVTIILILLFGGILQFSTRFAMRGEHISAINQE